MQHCLTFSHSTAFFPTTALQVVAQEPLLIYSPESYSKFPLAVYFTYARLPIFCHITFNSLYLKTRCFQPLQIKQSNLKMQFQLHKLPPVRLTVAQSVNFLHRLQNSVFVYIWTFFLDKESTGFTQFKNESQPQKD